MRPWKRTINFQSQIDNKSSKPDDGSGKCSRSSACCQCATSQNLTWRLLPAPDGPPHELRCVLLLNAVFIWHTAIHLVGLLTLCSCDSLVEIPADILLMPVPALQIRGKCRLAPAEVVLPPFLLILCTARSMHIRALKHGDCKRKSQMNLLCSDHRLTRRCSDARCIIDGITETFGPVAACCQRICIMQCSNSIFCLGHLPSSRRLLRKLPNEER